MKKTCSCCGTEFNYRELPPVREGDFGLHFFECTSCGSTLTVSSRLLISILLDNVWDHEEAA